MGESEARLVCALENIEAHLERIAERLDRAFSVSHPEKLGGVSITEAVMEIAELIREGHAK